MDAIKKTLNSDITKQMTKATADVAVAAIPIGSTVAQTMAPGVGTVLAPIGEDLTENIIRGVESKVVGNNEYLNYNKKDIMCRFKNIIYKKSYMINVAIAILFIIFIVAFLMNNNNISQLLLFIGFAVIGGIYFITKNNNYVKF